VLRVALDPIQEFTRSLYRYSRQQGQNILDVVRLHLVGIGSVTMLVSLVLARYRTVGPRAEKDPGNQIRSIDHGTGPVKISESTFA
jgi:hypothetical protein